MNTFDVIVIGGGQAGLAVGYYLRRSGLSYLILDNQQEPGGAWLHTWKSLRLFSPAQWSSLPGLMMITDQSGQDGGSDHYPTRDVTLEYIRFYEEKYKLQVKRPVDVKSVQRHEEGFILETSDGVYSSRAVVSATGSFANPYVPRFEGMGRFQGKVLHSSQYQSPEAFAGKRVAIVGEGNSGAQILAEVSKVAATLWITQKKPRFLPDHVDGRFLFDAATQLYEAKKQGKQYKPPSLGDIVMVESVKDARTREVLKSERSFERFTEDAIVWPDGREEKVDAIIFCTGFKASLKHLESLNIINEGKVETVGTRSKHLSGLWLVGYGNWTGFASATLIGVGRTAKTTVEEIGKYISASGISVNS
jgi:putative flavoprotein involved in K+ transport